MYKCETAPVGADTSQTLSVLRWAWPFPTHMTSVLPVCIVWHNKGGHYSPDLAVQPSGVAWPASHLDVSEENATQEASKLLIVFRVGWGRGGVFRDESRGSWSGTPTQHGPPKLHPNTAQTNGHADAAWQASRRVSPALPDVACDSHFPAPAAVTHEARLGREDAGRLRALGRSPPPLMSPPAPRGQLASINVIAQMCEGDDDH